MIRLPTGRSNGLSVSRISGSGMCLINSIHQFHDDVFIFRSPSRALRAEPWIQRWKVITWNRDVIFWKEGHDFHFNQFKQMQSTTNSLKQGSIEKNKRLKLLVKHWQKCLNRCSQKPNKRRNVCGMAQVLLSSMVIKQSRYRFQVSPTLTIRKQRKTMAWETVPTVANALSCLKLLASTRIVESTEEGMVHSWTLSSRDASKFKVQKGALSYYFDDISHLLG